MVENISTMKAHHDSDNFSVMADILKAVALDSEPVPSEQRTRHRNDPLFSPPPACDDITPRSMLVMSPTSTRLSVLVQASLQTRQHQPRQRTKSPLSVLPLALIRQ